MTKKRKVQLSDVLILLKLKTLGFKLYAKSINGYDLVQYRFSKDVNDGKIVLAVLREKHWSTRYVIWTTYIKHNGEQNIIKVKGKNSFVIHYFDTLIEYFKIVNVLRPCVCLPLAQCFNLPTNLIAQNRCYRQ